MVPTIIDEVEGWWDMARAAKAVDLNAWSVVACVVRNHDSCYYDYALSWGEIQAPFA